MEVIFGPNSVDEPNLLYKLQRKIKVFNTVNPLGNRGYNLVASSSRYGLVFVAAPDGTLSVYYLKDLIDKESEAPHLTIKLQEAPTHIAISCDQELLAVTGGQLLCIFKVADLPNSNGSPSLAIRCEVNPSTFVSGLQWNPCIPDTIAIAYYDGTLLMSQVSNSQVKKVASKARCLCWSPKGKQIVTGNSDGTLSQYKPDLTPAKTIPAPNLFQGAPVEALAVYWISTFQFAVVYRNAMDNSRPAVTIVNTPKAGQPSCLNYEDICYSMGSNRPWYYYLQGLAQWNIIMASSSNGMEIATLGSKDGANWFQWCQPDEARPELPLTDKKQENYPVGVCIDTCAIHQLPWGENSTLPYMPSLLVVSQSGLLTIFNVINLHNDNTQVCTPPQQLALPAAAMTSTIPGEVPAPPAQAAAPAPTPAPAPVSISLVQPKPQNVPVQSTTLQQQASQPALPQFTSLNIPKPSFAQPISQGFTAVPAQPEQKRSLEIKPQQQTPVAQQQTPVSTSELTKQQMTAQAQESAALIAEQERINEKIANQELKNMLIKEVNDFQMELYKFRVKTRETQVKLQRDIDSINANFTFTPMDSEQLKKECSLDELRGAIIQLKLELVRTCAVIAEARSHAEAKDMHQWTQADPLTTKRVASVKKLAYYIQTQLDQAQKYLDYRWNEALSMEPYKPGQRMIRPYLDDVYQPLVKQQEILSRQQAVLRTLRNTLNDCDITPMFKSTSLLRSTPFKNKDPLSKLTKNILNMSIEPIKTKEPLLTSQKVDALRDMLSNHKTVKIKPVNVEMRQHLATMRMNYQKSLKEKSQSVVQPVIKAELDVKPVIKPVMPQPVIIPKVEPKFEFKPDPGVQSQISVPSFTPVVGAKPNVPGISNVARTLFGDDSPKTEPPKASSVPQIQQQPKPQPAFGVSNTTIQANTRSVLKDLLQNKQASVEAKNDANTFMGQPICSPSTFAFGTNTSTPSASPSAFTAKPISDINNMFNKFQPQAFVPETKALETKSQDTKPQSSETGEPETVETKTIYIKPKPEKQMTNLFAMKPSNSNVPDVLKTTPETKPEIKAKIFENDKAKENVPVKTENSVNKVVTSKDPVSVVATNKTSMFGQVISSSSTPSEISKPSEPKLVSKVEATKVIEKSESASSISSVTASKQDQVESKSETRESSAESVSSIKSSVFSTSSSAASIFGSAMAAQSQPSEASSIFAAAVSSSPSKDGTTTTTSSVFSGSSQSVFNAAENASKPSVFSTPTPASPTPPTPSATTATGSIFSSSPKQTAFATSESAATTSVFATATSALGSTTTSASVFGTSTTTTVAPVFGIAASTSSSVFASVTTTTPSAFTSNTPTSAFESTAITTTTQSIFGVSPTTKSSAFGGGTSVFGSPNSQSNQSPTSVFGAPSTQSSVFGSSAAAPASVFASVSTTQGSVFGSSSPSSTQASIFGPSTTQASVFGSPTATTQASIFGGATPTTQASIFGAATSTTQASVFGAATATTPASVFGTATPTTPSVFGSAPTNQASVFGSPPATTAQSSSLFGGAESNLFASASISTTSAPSPTSGGSIFGGGSSSSGSVFGGGNTNVFGGKTAFGQTNPTAAAIFGGAASTFGQQKPANNFWSGGSSNTESGFGSTGFGQQATTQASSIFGSSGGSFSTPAPAGQAFGSPQPAFGDKPSVFGSPQQTGASPAFGGSPVFGQSKPVFGQPSGFASPPSGGGFGSPTGGFGSSFGGFNKSPSGFGAPAAFGSGASFGGGAAFGSTSPSKVFGGQAPAAFSATQSNATFESLATQNTLTFGNLAQQSGQAPQAAAPSFNTSPSFTGWRG